MTYGLKKSKVSFSPLIIALKELHQKRMQEKEIKMWIRDLESLFYEIDKDKSGNIDREEYEDMINSFEMSDSLKTFLSGKFGVIDEDNNGYIDLNEFLTFFLYSPNFK